MAWLSLVGAVLRLISQITQTSRERQWIARIEANLILEEMDRVHSTINRMLAARRASERRSTDPRLLREHDGQERPDGQKRGD